MAGRECRCLVASRGIGGIRGHCGAPRGVGLSGTLVGPSGVSGGTGAIRRHWTPIRGCRVSGGIGGLAGSVGTQGTAGVEQHQEALGDPMGCRECQGVHQGVRGVLVTGR